MLMKVFRTIACVIGIFIGIGIIAFGMEQTNLFFTDIGESIKFGADFYTEMYDVTKEVGYEICNALGYIRRAIGLLIVSIGAVDVCYFLFKLFDVTNTKKKDIVITNQNGTNVCPPIKNSGVTDVDE